MLIVPVQLNLTVEMQLVLLSLLIVLTEDNMGVGLYLVYLNRKILEYTETPLGPLDVSPTLV